VSGSLGWNWIEEGREVEEMARVQAATGFAKDLAYRAWVAARGGVYVWVDQQTQPSQYLAHLPERDLVTSRGTLTLVNPEMMSRQVYELQRRATGMRSHITSLNPLRPENAADPWESAALQELARGHREISAVGELDGEPHMRLIRPLITEKSCLPCHASQGFREGDLRGAISVSVPLTPLSSVARRHFTVLTIGHGGIWVAGLAGLVFASYHLHRQVQNRLFAERELQHSEAERTLLAEHNARLQAEKLLAVTHTKLSLAAAIQRQLVPDKPPKWPGIEIAAVLRPSEATSGDFYDFLRFPDNSWGLLIGDVCGHGIDAAMVMAAASSHVRSMAGFCSDPAQILTRLNDYLVNESADGRFVTVFLARIDPRTYELSYASAGHQSVLLKSDGAVFALDATNLPLGVLADLPMEFAPLRILEPGDTLVLMTDGISETRNRNGELFGMARVVESLRAHASSSADAAAEALYEATRRFSGDGPQEDDITTVVLRMIGPPAAQPNVPLTSDPDSCVRPVAESPM
jgi:serine phosphatase RsbU (regulator of sigma subunit)